MLTVEQKTALDTVISSDEIPPDVKEIARDLADMYNYEPDASAPSENEQRERMEQLSTKLADRIETCEPYLPSDLADAVEEPLGTTQRGLDYLVEHGILEKKQHNVTQVTYWKPE